LPVGTFSAAAAASEPGLAAPSAFRASVTGFATFVGKSYEESALDFNYLSPSEGSWDSGDREILCLVMGPDQTTGSLAGTGV
jgi:hypothetical protein